ncbi:MAG: HAD family hydrolase [Dehalococcoidia bacterium]
MLFDLDGTLIDSEPQVRAAVASTLEAAGFDPELVASRPIIGPPIEDLLADVTGYRGEDADRIFQSFVVRYLSDFAPQTQPFLGAQALLDAISERGVAAAVVTNKTENAAREVLGHLGWAARFTAVVGSDSVARAKPHADPAIEALRVLEASADDAAILGDTRFDIECGAAAALAVRLGVTTGPDDASALWDAGATHVVDDLDAACGVLLGGAR